MRQEEDRNEQHAFMGQEEDRNKEKVKKRKRVVGEPKQWWDQAPKVKTGIKPSNPTFTLN